MTKTRITVKQAGIKPSLYRKIKQHALGGFYRLNAQSADLYTFTHSDSDWEGGWSWFSYPGTWDGNLAISLDDGKLYKIEEIIK
jgi:hypothetical protein